VDRESRIPEPFDSALYAAARAVFATAQMLPPSELPRVGRWIGRALRLASKPAGIARRNLARAPSLVPPAQAQAFLARVYDEIGTTLAELLLAPKLLARRELSRLVRLERFEIFDAARRGGRGAIAIIGHLANYELAGLAVTLAGYPLNSLARPLPSRRLDGYLGRLRALTGQRIIPREHAMPEMIRALRRNEILVVQLDLDAKAAGVVVDFLGRPASTHPSPAVLSLRYGAPIIPAEIFREGGVNRCILHDPIRPEAVRDAADPVRELTRRASDALDGFVRRHPDQWWWVLDRWRWAERHGKP
jgi:KDO2-lipid IV(A) lauroyltransferase